ncbi:ribosome biogenesis related GTP binding protein [Babesia ovis]|uniref:Ribosome biogenesis related GTP binding protein n=1 Tax=Babesia ovis TaxID=5869 RepID=A0A9W5TEJ8_BABOV|nr:ribosome biogenesis related GTP binding protein [Babesia ovis]
MLYISKFLKALQQLGPQGERSVPLSGNTLKEVIVKAIGKPTSSDEIQYFKRNNKTKPVAPCFGGEIRPKLKLMTTAIDNSEMPRATLPEVAFYGRTNAGKSCLINAICGHYGICPVGSIPGTTRKLHFYKVGSPPSIIFVDMPGYGYSSAKEDLTMKWNEFSLSYIKNRETLKLVIVLIDSRIGLKKSDFEVINFCDKYKIKWQIVLAKADTMKPVLLAKMMQKVRLETSVFRSSNGKVIALSSTKNQNLDEIRSVLEVFKVDKYTAHVWTNMRTKYKLCDNQRNNTANLSVPTTVNDDRDNTAQIEGIKGLQPNNVVLEKYDLWKHVKKPYPSYDKDIVALRCISEIFERFIPPPYFMEELNLAIDSTSTAAPVHQPSTQPASPIYVEAGGSLACDVHISLSETLTRNEGSEAIEENLIRDKVTSYQRHVARGMNPVTKVAGPNIGRSYKRVMSLYRNILSNKKLKWNSVDRDKLTWSAVYQKWERWSKKHPQLSGLLLCGRCTFTLHSVHSKCKHELATLLLEYMDLETYLEGEPVSQLTEDLEETQFLEQMHLLYDE